MDVERLFSGKGRVKILKILLEEGQVNITRLVKETGLHHRLVVRHLEELKELGIVTERRYNRMRLYEVDLKDPKISTLREILRALEAL